MSETSEERKTKDRHIADMRAKEMARQSYRIDGMRASSIERIADRFDKTVRKGLAQKKKGK